MCSQFFFLVWGLDSREWGLPRSWLQGTPPWGLACRLRECQALGALEETLTLVKSWKRLISMVCNLCPTNIGLFSA